MFSLTANLFQRYLGISTFSGVFLHGITTVLALPVKLLTPAKYYFFRIVYLASAKSKIKGLHPSIQFDGILRVVGSSKVTIGRYSRIGDGVEIGTEEDGLIKIGNHVRINRGVTLFAYNKINVGNHTLIGEFVSIRDANHGIAPDKIIHDQKHESSSISIGRDVWIGRGSVILPGVQIGDGCVIGANSVVTKSIPPGTIAVGTPAAPIRKR